MKILFVEPCHKNFGGYFRSLEICRSLSKYHQIDLLLSTDQKLCLKITKEIVNHHFTIYYLPRFYINFYLNGRVLRGLIAFLFGLFGKYDLVHVTSTVQIESNLPAFLLNLFGKKIVISWDDIWTNGSIKNPLLNIYIAFWEKISPRLFKNVVAISDIILQKAKKNGALRVVKIINGTDPDFFTPSKKISLKKLHLDPKFHYLITFGNTFNDYRQRLLLKTFHKIYSRDNHVKLIVNHDLPTNNSSLKKSIDNVGYIPEELLPYYLAAADGVLFPMGNSLNEKACFPVRVGKFLSGNSLIIINDNSSETVNTLKKYQCALIDKSLDSLSQKTVSYLNSPRLRRLYKKRIIKTKSDLTWDNLVRPLIKFYENII